MAMIVVAGVALGLGSAAATLWTMGNGGAIRVGPWVTPVDAGGVDRGPYSRAVIALRATLGLSRKEAIYFAATADSAGAALEGDCTYTVTGPDLPARWWSITLYGSDHYLVANPENRWSFASVNIAHDPGGGFTIWIGPDRHAGNWLDSAGAGSLLLLARLYRPVASAAAAPAGIVLPSITRVGCR